MVLAERGDNLRNGRRSRGPSPNGHGTPDSSSEDETATKRIGNSKSNTKSGTYEAEKIRVGRDYQATCPDLEPVEDRKPEQLAEKALLVWSPTKEIPDQKLEDYITVAKDKYGYNGEQALGMLFWHKHDLERAVLDLANFTPFPDEWTVEDKVLFEQAFQFHGKTFHRIRQMLPDKSIAALVKYYYSWKKTRTRSSVMDRQVKKHEAASENGSEHSNEESDTEEKKWPMHRGIRRASGSPPRGAASDDSAHPPQGPQAAPSISGGTHKGGSGSCAGCGVLCTHTHTTPAHGKLCQSCHHHWRRTGTLRPTSGTSSKRLGVGGAQGMGARVKRLPKGMHINHDDLLQMAKELQSPNSTQPQPTDSILQAMDREITSLKIQVQSNKQVIGSLKRKAIDCPGIEDLRPPQEISRVTSKWSNEELMLAVQCVRKYGKDFVAIAEAIGTKTEQHVRSFFVSYRRRYNLDLVLKDYEIENGLQMDVEPETIVIENSPPPSSVSVMTK